MAEDRPQTGQAGVYFVAAELSLRNYIATVTARNAPCVDIIATSPRLRSINIQVKANKPKGTHSFWLLGQRSKNDSSDTLFYVFVNLHSGERKPDYYVVPSRVVARRMSIERSRTGAKSTWYSFARIEKYRDRWDLLPI